MVKPEICGLGPSHAFLMDPQYTVNYRENLGIQLSEANVTQPLSESLLHSSLDIFTGFPLEMEMTQKRFNVGQCMHNILGRGRLCNNMHLKSFHP